MRTDFASEAAYERAVRDFAARLARSGVTLPFETAADACILLSASNTRPEVLKAADSIVAFLGGKGVKVTKDLVLEGSARFFALKSWDVLSAKLPRARVGGAVVETQADVLHLLVREEGGSSVACGEILWSYRHPDDKRWAAPRVVVARDGFVRVLEDAPTTVRCYETVPFDLGNLRKSAEWEANRLAAKWLVDARRACAMVEAAGFEVEDTGGGLTAWAKIVKDSPWFEVRITDAYGSHHRFGTADEVMVGVYRWDDAGDEGVVETFAGVEAALAAVPRLVAEAVERAREPGQRP